MLIMCQFDRKIIIVRLVSAVRPSSVTDNLRGRCHTISGYEMLHFIFQDATQVDSSERLVVPFHYLIIKTNIHYIDVKKIIY